MSEHTDYYSRNAKEAIRRVKQRIAELESQLAATQQRLAECEADAGRLDRAVEHEAPSRPVRGDLPTRG